MVSRIILYGIWGETSYYSSLLFWMYQTVSTLLPLGFCCRTCSDSLCKSGCIALSWVPQRSTEISDSYCEHVTATATETVGNVPDSKKRWLWMRLSLLEWDSWWGCSLVLCSAGREMFKSTTIEMTWLNLKLLDFTHVTHRHSCSQNAHTHKVKTKEKV